MVLLLATAQSARAEPQVSQPLEADPKPRSGSAFLPVASYAPETELALGMFGAYFFRLADEPTASRPSSVAAVGLLTTRKQAIFELIPEVYWGHGRYRLWSKLDYRHFPNSLWGVGNDMPDSQRERYTESGPRLQLQMRRRLVDNVYLEGRLDLQYMRLSGVDVGGLLDRGAVPGASAGRVFGLGPSLLWDTRNHLLWPTFGGFYELTVMQYTKLIGGEYDFARTIANLRRFIPLGGTHVLATQLYFEGTFGNTPFHQLAMVGGQRMLRGYFEGRYRDRYLAAAQVEYRSPVLWRLSGVAFAGVGDVAPTLRAFGDIKPKWSVGGGARFLLNRDEHLNLRADVGFTLESWGLYVGIAEAF